MSDDTAHYLQRFVLFGFKVAPALHPPYNITSNTNNPLNWTVSLSWAMPFFVSVVDGSGQLWSSGPLHSGGGPFSSTGCLSGEQLVISPCPEISEQLNFVPRLDRSSIQPYIAIVSGGGGLLLGLLAGILIAWLFLWKSKKTKLDLLANSPTFGDPVVIPGQYPLHDQYAPIPTTSSSGLSTSLLHGYQVEPFRFPDEDGRVHSGITSQSHASGHTPSLSATQHRLTYEREPSSPTAMQPQHTALQQSHDMTPSRPSQVYVVHHDSQTPPVTIYHQQGTEVVELPPRYPPTPSAMLSSPEPTTEGRSTSSEVRPNTRNSLSLHQPRHVGTIRKLTMSDSTQ